MNIDRPSQSPRSHLFTVRVWQEEMDRDQTEWRGKVQLLTSGDVRYFRHWAALVPLLVTMLTEMESQPEVTRETSSGGQYGDIPPHEENSEEKDEKECICMAQLETDVEPSREKRSRWRPIAAWAGIIGPILFFVVSMIDGFLHPNYSTLSEPISNLGAKAPNVWIQDANFFLSGLLLVIFAIGFFWQLRLVTKGWWGIISTFFLLLTGACLALASVFPTDIPGYPPVTLHGLIHDIIFFVVFATLLIAVLLSGLLFKKIPGWHGYGWYSIIQAIVMVLLFVILAAVTVSDGGLMGLFQRIFVYEAFSWYVVMGIHFLVLERGRKE